MIRSFPSQNAALKNVPAIASFAQAQGLSFSPPQKSGAGPRNLSPTEAAHRHTRGAVKESFSKMLPAF